MPWATTLPTGTLSFTSGATGAALTRTFTVPINDDAADELDTETFTVTLGTNLPAVVDVGDPAASVETTITDDDVPLVTLADPYPPEGVAEDALNTLMGFGVTVGPRAQETVVEYRFGGMATGAVQGTPEAATADYRYADRNTLTFAAGPTEETRIIQVAILDDMIVEGTETFTLELVPDAGYRFPDGAADPVSGNLVKTGMILDDDAPVASLSGPDAVDESAGTAEYTITLGGSPSADVDVTWAVTGGGSGAVDADADPEDFGDGTETTPPSGTLSFTSGATGAALTRTFTIAINDDGADELDTETFTVTLGTNLPDVVDVGTPPASVETTITDDDVPVATVTGPASVGEDAGALGDGTPTGDDTAITVTLAPAPVADVTVAWMIAGSGTTPAVAADFGTGAGLRSGTFTFTAGTTDLTRTIPVTIADDTTDEPDEAFTVTLSAPAADAGYLLGAPDTRSATVMIADDDVPVATVSGPASVNEDAGTLGDGTPTGDDTAITVTLAPAPATDVTVAWTITGSGTNRAEAADFGSGAGLRSGTFTFTAGTTDLTRTIPVTIADDTTAEPDETFTVTLTGVADEDAAGYAVSPTDGTHEVTITDDGDASPSRSTVTAVPDRVTADGKTESTVTVALLDFGGDPVTASRGTVTLAVTGSAAVSGDGVTETGEGSRLWTARDNGDGTYTATLTNRRAETVTVSASLDGTDLEDTADVTFEADVGHMAREVADFLEERALLITGHRSDVHRRVARLRNGPANASGDRDRASGEPPSSPPTFAMDGAEGAERVRFSWSCARGAPGTACGGRDDWWMEGHLGRYTSGDAGGTFAIAHAGIDRLIGRDLLVGIAVQYDRVDREGRRERTDGGPVARISADGWMAGPYLTARLDDRIAAITRWWWGRTPGRPETRRVSAF